MTQRYPGSAPDLRADTGIKGIVHHVVSVRDLRAANPMRLPMHGANNIILYLGFPVLVSIDGDEMVQGGLTVERGASPASYISQARQGIYRIRRPVRELFLSLPPGLGATADSQIHALHALCRIEGTFSPDMEPELLTPTMLALPTHSSRMGTVLAHALGTETNTQVSVGNDAIWGQGSAYLLAHTVPEVWIAGVTWRVTQGNLTDLAPAGFTVPEWGLYTFDGPVGNQESLMRFKCEGDGHYGSHTFSPPYHLPHKDVADATGGVNGAFRLSINHDAYAIVDADITFEALVNFWYRH